MLIWKINDLLNITEDSDALNNKKYQENMYHHYGFKISVYIKL